MDQFWGALEPWALVCHLPWARLWVFPMHRLCASQARGSIQMNIQELSTCKQYGLPVKIINLNNQSLGMVKQWQDMQYEGRHSHSYMDSLPDFVKLAESYGHAGIKISKPSELRSGLEAAFAKKDELVFVDIEVDREEHVYPMQIAPNGSMRDMWLKKGCEREAPNCFSTLRK